MEHREPLQSCRATRQSANVSSTLNFSAYRINSHIIYCRTHAVTYRLSPLHQGAKDYMPISCEGQAALCLDVGENINQGFILKIKVTERISR